VGIPPGIPFIRAMAWAESSATEALATTPVSLLGGARGPTWRGARARRRQVHPYPERHRSAVLAGACGRSARGAQPGHRRPAGNKAADRSVQWQSRSRQTPSGNVIEAAGFGADEPGVHFLLVGQGPEKESLHKCAREAGLGNITFLPSVGRSQMPLVDAGGRLGYIGLQKKDLFRYGVSPNKLYEYMAAGLPILFAIDTIHDEVSEAQCGFFIRPTTRRPWRTLGVRL